VPLGNTEKKALEEMPNNDELERSFQFAKPRAWQTVVELLNSLAEYPACAVPDVGRARRRTSCRRRPRPPLDCALVKGEDPDKNSSLLAIRSKVFM